MRGKGRVVEVKLSRWAYSPKFTQITEERNQWLEELLRGADAVFDALGHETGLTMQIKRALSGKPPFDPPEKT